MGTKVMRQVLVASFLALGLLHASPAMAVCVPTPGGLEICDGLDNDCNAKIDAADSANITGVLFNHDQPLCEKQWGVCQNSKKTIAFCKLGVWKTCTTSLYSYWNSAYELGVETGAHTCDGLDNDCDNAVDENYVPVPSTCGVGACASTGMSACVNGNVTAGTCTPGTPAADDATCNAIDDDCDGTADEDFVAVPSACGTGACAATGSWVCQGSIVVDTCVAGTPGSSEVCWNDVDDDCNGFVDENCGPLCVPTAGVDTVCDGLDDDCDGQTDEDFVDAPATCGTGACAAQGTWTCQPTGPVSDCVAGTPAASDSTCDATDDDCDGAIDEEFAGQATTCGVGACASTGATSCVGGDVLDSCVIGQAAASDATCDATDDDCDGAVDEEFAGQATTCGVGACASTGATSCVGGDVVDSCASGQPAASDATCDAIDDDCDGTADEDFATTPSACGLGVCAATGQLECRHAPACGTEPGLLELEVCVVTFGDFSPLCACLVDASQGVGVAMECCQAYWQADPSGCVAWFDENRAPGAPTAEFCEVDTCTPLQAAASDTLCNGQDDDCDGSVDEDFVPLPTTCGEGGCANVGTLTCVDGHPIDSCVAGTNQPSDPTCDGVDDDCDGVTDDDYVATTTGCGVGACARTGLMTCEEAHEVDSCVAGTPALADATCDDSDDDCNGVVDDGYVATGTTCGVGACASTGSLTCQGGAEVDSCAAGAPAPADVTCDASDDDCNGLVDDGYAPVATVCGVGACASAGSTSCMGGHVLDSCTAGQAAASDATCDGIDDNCNGVNDEQYVARGTTCGIGACAGLGVTSCVAGDEHDSCVVGQPAFDDATCDGVDDDCNGLADDGYVPYGTTCGVGACARTGSTACEGGDVLDSCVAGEAAASDASCDGSDDDCDGVVDDDYADQPVTCGVGACMASGSLVCNDGHEIDTCSAGVAALDDLTCDGIDDDCNGAADDGFVAYGTTCGVGACASTGSATCVDGDVLDSCTAGVAAASDLTCDGSDDDCNGLVDDGYVPQVTECGVGACATIGETSCVGGTELDSCTPGTPSLTDTTCDGLDDNCDGAADEGYEAYATSCGVGACASTGSTSCVAGDVLDSCVAGTPAPADETCDGVDDDCNGSADDGYVTTDTTCGVGVCASTGTLSCVGGDVVDSCVAGLAAPADASCNGADDDCNGQTDEDYVVVTTGITCGQGACKRNQTTTCVDGNLTTTCVPGLPAPEVCDNIDNDCNGKTDSADGNNMLRNDRPYCEKQDGVCFGTQKALASCYKGTWKPCIATFYKALRPAYQTIEGPACDGLDNDCDATTDEAYVATPTQCGQSECAATGSLACQGGQIVDTCEPLAAAADDSACDGHDNDCDDAIDEDFVSYETPTTCGTGPCTAHAMATCVDGQLGEICTPGQGAASDETCDGVDDDCNGVTDDAGALACDDGDPCTADACVDAACVTTIAAGVACDDLDAATFDDACTPLGGCQGVPDGLVRASDTQDPWTDEQGGDCAVCDDADYSLGTVFDVDVDDAGTTPLNSVVRRVQVYLKASNVGNAPDAQVWLAINGVYLAEAQPVQGAVCDSCVTYVFDSAVYFPDGIFEPDYLPASLNSWRFDLVYATEPWAVVEFTRVVDYELICDVDDTTCNRTDDDCDGQTDEDYVATASGTVCGLGACQADEMVTCVDGAFVPVCTEGAATGDDTDCDGTDDDCDGEADESYPVTATECGLGVCYNVGTESCSGGRVVDSCEPLPGADTDDCDGLDSDCNGLTDDDFVAGATACGIGGCARTGELLCLGLGGPIDTCFEGTPAADDSVCNAVDDDCDGTVDEEYVVVTSCFLPGVCAAGDAPSSCVEGHETPCQTGATTGDDTDCDGNDDDCDGAVDESYVATATECGVGACYSTGTRTCVEGNEIDSCVAGTPGADDDCDAVDDDCDGANDDDYVVTGTNCGLGACVAEGMLTCVNGAESDSCRPLEPSLADDNCNGFDEDCDGTPDDDYLATTTTCGLGACAETGDLVCSHDAQVCGQDHATFDYEVCSGIESIGWCDCIDYYQAADPAVAFAQCCFLYYFSPETSEGQAYCEDVTALAAGVSVCEHDTCEIDWAAQAANDATCDGLDDDCSGAPDEDYVSFGTRCGIGGCVAEGVMVCPRDGNPAYSTCVPLEPSLADDNCNGFDEDCDGNADDDYPEVPTTCGLGACAEEGMQVCAHSADICTQQHATFDYEVCLGIEEAGWCDCIDYYLATTPDVAFEQCCFVGFFSPETEGGQAYCEDVTAGAAGVSVCEHDTCEINVAAQAADDSLCNGVDDDCDGTVDESAESYAMCNDGDQCTADACVNGACLNVGTPEAACDDQDPMTSDDTCDYRGECEGVVPGAHRYIDHALPPAETHAGCSVCGTGDYALAAYHEFGIDDSAALPPTATVTRIRVKIRASHIQGLLADDPLPALAINDEFLAVSVPGLQGAACDSCQTFDFDTLEWFDVEVPAYLPGELNTWAFDPLTDVDPWALVSVARTIDYTCPLVETNCADQIDDDCDGSVDAADSDCVE